LKPVAGRQAAEAKLQNYPQKFTINPFIQSKFSPLELFLKQTITDTVFCFASLLKRGLDVVLKVLPKTHLIIGVLWRVRPIRKEDKVFKQYTLTFALLLPPPIQID
jgi:hypothetical protein